MTGPEHWEEADTIVTGDRCDYGCPHAGCAHEMAYLARAQVHATLALAATRADVPAVVVHVDGKIASSEHARALAKQIATAMRTEGGGAI